MKRAIVLLILIFNFSFAFAQKPRARDLGLPFSGTTGPYNAI
ncbi:hypothetical protein SAMN03080598_01639 [Algoriphagus boritolerans DSM 17298 = JCM 18970]|uniref:Uncharacterized protein n=1 Tax=Algoriphagus boritolerans DSM 17298 = JCM 18970 TaxID=1120964 RepID=A0A1H5VBW5_9BACT|nr:hypothetical protein SAMN03080598_01639 [Algoriphagus boritolerans DSM 17298 = JCM 18970]